METIPKDSCTKIGFIQKTHGIHGELVIRFDETYYETLDSYPTLFLEIDQLLVPFFIEEDGLRFKSGESVIAKLEWIDTDKKAKALNGLSVYVANDAIVANDEDLNMNELIGYKLFDETLGFIGEIEDVTDYSGNVLLIVEYQGKEAMVPLNEDLIIRLDEENREIELSIPEGLFDLDDE